MTLGDAWSILCEGTAGDRAEAGVVLQAELRRLAPQAAQRVEARPQDPLVEDSLQRVLIRLLERPHVLRDTGPGRDLTVRAYLRQCLVRACIDGVRKRDRHWDGRDTERASPEGGDPGPRVEQVADPEPAEHWAAREAIEHAALLLDQTLLPAYVEARNIASAGAGTRAAQTLAQIDELSASNQTAEDLARTELESEQGRPPDDESLRRKTNALYKRFERARETLLSFLGAWPTDDRLTPWMLRLAARIAEDRYRINRRPAP